MLANRRVNNAHNVVTVMNKLEDSLTSMISRATTTYASRNEPTVLTVDMMLKTMATVEELIAEFDAPFRTWMVEQGRDPKAGYVLWLPWQMRDEVGAVPYFVLFGKGITAPTITKDHRLHSYNFKFTND